MEELLIKIYELQIAGTREFVKVCENSLESLKILNIEEVRKTSNNSEKVKILIEELSAEEHRLKKLTE